MASRRHSLSGSSPCSARHPALFFSRSAHGARFETTTGVPAASASATVIPKFSECRGVQIDLPLDMLATWPRRRAGPQIELA